VADLVQSATALRDCGTGSFKDPGFHSGSTLEAIKKPDFLAKPGLDEFATEGLTT